MGQHPKSANAQQDDFKRHCVKCGSSQMLSLGAKIGFACKRCGHDNYLNSKPAVMGVFVRARQVLLVRDLVGGAWDLPGGFLNNGEPPEEGLRRECREEIGVEPTNSILREAVIDAYGVDEWALNLAYEVLEYTGSPRAGGEIVEISWKPLGDLPMLKYPGTGHVLASFIARS